MSPMVRRPLPWIVALAATLHVLGMARSELPAQDGLKFIKVARRFHERPWGDVIRGTDQHPLYPAAIALAQPIAASFAGQGPDCWRLAAQGVSALASLALLWPLSRFTHALFGARTAALACLIYVILPVPAEIGHDTLSDPLALLAFALAMQFGERALREGGLREMLACGLAGGLGYLARPEIALAPLAVLLTAALRVVPKLLDGSADRMTPASGPRFATLALPLLVAIGSYALVKGEVSEKLALRQSMALAPSARPKAVKPSTEIGLDSPTLDFSAKEESGHAGRLKPIRAATWMLHGWAEDLGWFLPIFTAWGLVRVRANGPGKRLALVYAAAFFAILLRHATALGYLSNRHELTLCWLAVPWTAAGITICTGRAGGWFRPRVATALGAILLAGLIALGVGAQLGTAHESRRGHGEAGRWLAEHAGPADRVLDTRGWAAFVSDRREFYDYWHVRKALKDPALRYVVVGADELAATSKRAATLRAWLAFAATPLATFPGRVEGEDVRIYRFECPASWEGLRP